MPIAPSFTSVLTSAVILFGTALSLSACLSPEENLAAVVEENQACTADDQCVVAGGSDCTCGAIVNEDGLAAVEAAAAAIPCCNILGQCVAVECAAFIDIGCVDNVCQDRG